MMYKKEKLYTGQIIVTSLSDRTVVIEVCKDYIVLFANNQFVLIRCIYFDGYKYWWDSGSYFYSIKEIYEEIKRRDMQCEIM